MATTRVEIDIYGGYKGSIVEGLSYDVGVLTYQYPSNKLGDIPGFANANTTEIYGALTYGPATLKYSHSVTNLFGFVDSKNSDYLDLSASFDLGSRLVADAAHRLTRRSVAHNSRVFVHRLLADLGQGLGQRLLGLGGRDRHRRQEGQRRAGLLLRTVGQEPAARPPWSSA